MEQPFSDDDPLVSDAREALQLLEDEVEDDSDLDDLLDNFEVVASAFDALLFPKRHRLREIIGKPKPLHGVVRAIARKKEAKERKRLKKLAKRVKDQTKDIRQASYRGFDFDTSDMIGDANDLREELMEVLATLLPEPDDTDQDESE
jgi:hypothetical protein